VAITSSNELDLVVYISAFAISTGKQTAMTEKTKDMDVQSKPQAHVHRADFARYAKSNVWKHPIAIGPKRKGKASLDTLPIAFSLGSALRLRPRRALPSVQVKADCNYGK
jgi:hypothetical protein